MINLDAIIVEDEPLARKSLERLCEKSNQIKIVGVFEDGMSALDFLNSNEVDLVFLDIEMPGLTGLELMEKLNSFPQIIFTTSKKEYAYDAFEYDITDFLKKPLVQNRFSLAVKRALERAKQLDAIAQSSIQNEIYIRTDGKLIRIPYSEVLYFENVGDYIKLIHEKGNAIFHGALKKIDERIQHPRLIKVHRSYIINLDKVIDIQDNSVLLGKKIIPISRAYKPILIRSLNILNH